MANCANCSAPLPSGKIQCLYCGSRNDIDLKGINYYTTNEPDSERICPRCNIRLKTIDLKVEGKFLVERCDQCLGLFFDPGELEALLNSTVTNVFAIDRSRMDAINATRRADDYAIGYIKCPVCANMMNRINFGVKSGVIVDRCKAHGVWLDGGELRHLAEWMKAGGKMLDQQRQEELKRKEAEDELKRQRAKGQKSGAEDYSDYSTYRTDSFENDLFDLLKKAVGFLIR